MCKNGEISALFSVSNEAKESGASVKSMKTKMGQCYEPTINIFIDFQAHEFRFRH